MSFDLNINNYTRDELIEMFELPSNFDKNILEMKESKLRESIVNNKEINKDTQSKTLDFLIKAKKQILNTLQKESGALQEKLDTIYNINRDLGPSNLSKLENKQYQIQERPVYPYVFTSAEDTITGIINPLAKSTITKNLNIDSRFRDNYFNSSSTNFNFKLPANFNNVVKMELAAIELPTSYYVISKQYGNNFFSITVNSSTTTISIPDGNYDTTTIIDAINNQLSLAGSRLMK